MRAVIRWLHNIRLLRGVITNYLGRHVLPVAERRECVSPLLLLFTSGRPSPSLSTQRTSNAPWVDAALPCVTESEHCMITLKYKKLWSSSYKFQCYKITALILTLFSAINMSARKIASSALPTSCWAAMARYKANLERKREMERERERVCEEEREKVCVSEREIERM